MFLHKVKSADEQSCDYQPTIFRGKALTTSELQY